VKVARAASVVRAFAIYGALRRPSWQNGSRQYNEAMSKAMVFFLLVACGLRAEMYPMTLRQAVETALKQNPDVMMARLDEQKARLGIKVEQSPYYPRVVAGSGLAYSNGFPLSIEGAAPSVFQVQATQDLFNRPQQLAIAEAREKTRGAELSAAGKREDIAYRVTSLYLDAARASRLGTLAQRDTESLQQVLDTVHAQVQEGRALPLAEKQARLNLAKARQEVEGFADDQDTAESALAVALGYMAQDRVRAVEEEPAVAMPAESEEAVIQHSLESRPEMQELQSEIAAKTLEVRGYRAARLPRVDLVSQYAMLAEFNNYNEFFKTFQRNNGQIGASFQVPIWAGPGVKAQIAQAQTDIEHLRVQLTAARNRVTSDIQQAYRDVRKAATGAEVAGADLDLAREQLTVILAQTEEGRANLGQVGQARITENDKWIAFYDAQYTLDRARWNLLRLSGDLVPSLEAGSGTP
jgi:outer membrane protein